MPGRARRPGDSEPDREPADTPRDASGDPRAADGADAPDGGGSPAGPVPPDGARDEDAFTVPVEPRRKQFFVSRQDTARLAGFFPPVLPADIDKIIERLRERPDVTLDRVIEPAGLAMLAASPTTVQRVAVATMSRATAQQVGSLDRGLLVEENPLVDIDPPPVPPFVARRTMSAIPFGGLTTWQIRVTGPDGAPAVGASVFVYGSHQPVQGITDQSGLVTLSLLNETDETITALFVNPQSGHWSLWIDDPQLTSSRLNHVRLRPLDATFGSFDNAQVIGWGQQAMRFDQLDPRFTGSGIKVAVIDSGAATTHRDLDKVSSGRDFTVLPPNDAGWTDDVFAHGTHCSGVIAGADNAAGIRGCAPGAEVRALRVFPGGHFDSIFDALDYCIAQQIDVVNLSLGSSGTVDTVATKLRQAKQAGVACIVAAGNSAGPVQFPGNLPDVLTVAAIGKFGTFPQDSVHAQQIAPDVRSDRGYFSAAFTCHGPEIDVCAPGVAIVSSVPPDGFAVWDGTSMAAPHVAGLAALVLAHHPDFSGGQGRGTAARVDRLFSVIKASATPLDLGDPGRTGAGVPDAVAAVTGNRPLGGTQQPSGPATAAVDPQVVSAALDRLRDRFTAVGLL